MQEKQRPILRRRLAAMLLIPLLLSFAAAAPAEHEADHRYDVRGYVLDAERQPRSGVPVTVLMDGGVAGSARTDGNGYYSIRLHLHDSDIGRALTVRAGDFRLDTRMTAVRGDSTSARIHHVNFVGGEPVEEKLAGRGLPAWAYFAAVPVVLWAAYHVAGMTRRKARRMKKAKAQGEKKGKKRGKRKGKG